MNRSEIIKKNYKKKWMEKKKQEAITPEQRAYRNRIIDHRTGKPPYSFEEFKKHMESKFIFEKIGWFNYGSEWEVDHILPLISGGKDELENLQPLSKSSNRSKRY